MFTMPKINVPIIGVVENMAYFTPPELPNNKYYIFGKDGGKQLAEAYDVAFLGEIPLQEAIREGGDKGNPVSMDNTTQETVFKNIAEKVARQIAIQNAKKAEVNLIKDEN